MAPVAHPVQLPVEAAGTSEKLVVSLGPSERPMFRLTLTKFLRDVKAKSSEPGETATAHGFRSSFRDWASENSYQRDWAERALAHTIQNQAEAAYHRTELLDQRRTMMEDWAAHVTGVVTAGKVVPLRA